MTTVVGTTASNYPQTSNNDTVSAILEEIAEYEGGGSRDAIINRARRCLRRATREFNAMVWKFNRITEDITLSAEVSGTVGEYDLAANFYRPLRAQMVDSDDKTRETVEWIEWRDWARYVPDQSTTGSMPLAYTARNIHLVGRVIVDPPPATTLTYPTMRLFYFRRIAFPADNEVFNVPAEFQDALVQRAIFHFISKVRSFREATIAGQSASGIHQQMIEVYRDWEDS